MLEKIPRKKRAIVNKPNDKELAKLYSEKTAKEIAIMYDVTMNTVYSWIHRARKKQEDEHNN